MSGSNVNTVRINELYPENQIIPRYSLGRPSRNIADEPHKLSHADLIHYLLPFRKSDCSQFDCDIRTDRAVFQLLRNEVNILFSEPDFICASSFSNQLANRGSDGFDVLWDDPSFAISENYLWQCTSPSVNNYDLCQIIAYYLCSVNS